MTDIHTLVLLPELCDLLFELLQVQGVLKLIDSVPVLSPKDFGSLKVGCRENTAGSNTQDVYVVCFGMQHNAKPTGSPPYRWPISLLTNSNSCNETMLFFVYFTQFSHTAYYL